MNRTIYLDNSATTRICDVALEKYNEVSKLNFGNPSSLHTLGLNAEKEIRTAKKTVTDSLNFKDGQVVFTASGTEANNLAIIGRAYAKERFKNGGKIITFQGEHASVSEPILKLQKDGFNTIFIGTRGGKLDFDALEKELCGQTVLVSCMMVNNETGALYDIKRLVKEVKARAKGALVHVDATQSYIKVPINAKDLGVDMITVSSHKIHGPKGVGALVISKDLIKTGAISPIIFGGGQEDGLRSGTENVPAIAAFAAAIEEGIKHFNENEGKIKALRQYLIEKIENTADLREVSMTLPEICAPHILNITLPSIKSETMLHYLSREGIFVSSGSACSSNSNHKSSALVAYGRSEKDADSSIRISLCRDNTKEDADALCSALAEGIKKLARIR